jgi:CrcB protein
MEHEDNVPDDYGNLDELASPAPVENPDEQRIYRHESLEDTRHPESYPGQTYAQDNLERRQSQSQRHGDSDGEEEDENLTEIAAPAPVSHGTGISEAPGRGKSDSPPTSSQSSGEKDKKRPSARQDDVSQTATQLYTISALVFFSILGTLARLGLQALTTYPGNPVQEGVVWANFAGSLFMGYLSEERNLFSEGWGPADDGQSQEKTSKRPDEENNGSKSKEQSEAEKTAAKKRHSALKKSIPLYIGLATGFCGSLTSFSSFMRDVFLALSNNLPIPVPHSSASPNNPSTTAPRNGGYSFMALIAVIIVTLCLSLGALQCGAHLAIALEGITHAVKIRPGRRLLDRAVLVIGWGAWLGAIIMAVWPPDRPGGPSGRSAWSHETWRGEAIFALVFAPLGCLLRFYASTHLNGRIVSFPLGTFVVNVFGTIVLGMCYDLQHAPFWTAGRLVVGGGQVGCQVLHGVMDGFCGCLTTVSTWVLELKTLRNRHAYVYGLASVGVSLAFLVVIMGSLRWTVGFSTPACMT